jgi:hypothetical protein
MRRPRAWSWSPGTSRRVIAEKMEGPPRFLEDLRARALLSDPGGIAHARPLRRRDAAFRHFHDVGSRDLTLSGLNHTARSLAVYASQPGSPRSHARLAPGRRPGSTGRGWLPARSQRKVSAVASPFPKLFLAHESIAATPRVTLSTRRKLFRDGRNPNDFGVIFTRDNSDNCRMAPFYTMPRAGNMPTMAGRRRRP